MLKINLPGAFDSALARYSELAFESLSRTEQLLVTIWGIESEVNNGGFDQYYFNTAGDHAHLAVAAFYTIGADQMATLVEKANAIFGRCGPPSSRDDRQKALMALTEANECLWEDLDMAFRSYPDKVEELLERYLAKQEFDGR